MVRSANAAIPLAWLALKQRPDLDREHSKDIIFVKPHEPHTEPSNELLIHCECISNDAESFNRLQGELWPQEGWPGEGCH